MSVISAIDFSSYNCQIGDMNIEKDDNEVLTKKRRKFRVILDDEEEDTFDIMDATPKNSASVISNGNASLKENQVVISLNKVKNHSDGDDKWMEKRNSKVMTETERLRNISIAKQQRAAISRSSKSTPQSVGYKIPKKANADTICADDDYDIESIIEIRSPLPKFEKSRNLNGINEFSLDENDFEVFNRPTKDGNFKSTPISITQRSKRKVLDREQRLEERNKKSKRDRDTSESKTPRSIVVEEDSDKSSMADENEKETGWEDTLDEDQIMEEATRILKNCDDLSKNLKESLHAWQSGDVKRSDVKFTEHCVDLTEINADNLISTDASTRVIQASDVLVWCPNLHLKNYQLVGINWLKLLHENKVNGVLADDMGLGKTIQTIAFLAWLRFESDQLQTRKKKFRPILIVVPATTLSNWQNELERFCPNFNVVTYHGTLDERREVRHMLRRCMHKNDDDDDDDDDEAIDIILCTYTMFERESGKDDRNFLLKLNFEYLILDEAHCIKNSKSSRYAHLNFLKTNHRLLLSGTPVQNDITELLALLSFLMPGVFGRSKCNILSLAFGWGKQNGIKNGKGHSLAGDEALNRLRNMLAPFVLRRLKRDVLNQLVDKKCLVIKLDMTDVQRQVYDSVITQHKLKKENNKNTLESEQSMDRILNGKPVNKKKKQQEPSKTLQFVIKKQHSGPKNVIDLASPGENTDRESNSNGIKMITTVSKEDSNELFLQGLSSSEANNIFTALRKAANHPLLLRVRYQDPAIMDRVAQVAYAVGHFGNQCNLQRVKEELENYSDFDIHQLCLEYADRLGKYELSEESLFDSPKMRKLKELLPDLISEGHRILVFSQWTRIMDLLEVLLQSMSLAYLRLDGGTPIRERQYLIDTFTIDTTIPIFLLSTKAGGLGINLTSADTVIMHDLDFNPENDRQAEDRCHRIGQVKPVTVYKFVTADTVDEDIHEMGERKRELTHAILSDERSGVKGNNPSVNGIHHNDEELLTISKILQKALTRN